MALQLTERDYRRPGLEASLLEAMPDRYVRRAEADVSALVQAGELDYIWTYRNLAKAHGLRWVELPAGINLEQPAWRSWYAQASVVLPGAPHSAPLHLVGAPIMVGLALTPQNPETQVRKLGIFEHILLDGVIQHSADDDDIPYSDWTAPYRTPAGRDARFALKFTGP